MVNGRPRKTQEELDAEMEDYWDNAGAPNGTAAVSAAAMVTPAAMETNEDIDMIE